MANEIKQVQVGTDLYDIRDASKLPLAGGTVSGNLTVSGTLSNTGLVSTIAMSSNYIQLKNSAGTVLSQVALPVYNGSVI